MGKPDRIESSASAAFLNDDALPAEVTSQVRREYWYHQTFFFPIAWTIGVDERGTVVSKHRWD